MMMKAAVLCVVAVMLMVAEARSPDGVVYPFPIDSVLRCRRPDPHVPGQTFEIPTPVIPLVPREPDQVWLPEEVRFRPPSGTVDAPWLVPLLREAGYFEDIHILDCPSTINGGPRNSPEIPILGSAMTPPPVDVVEVNEDILVNLGLFSTSEQATIRNFWNRVGFTEDSGCDDAIYQDTKLPDYYYPPCYVGGRCSGENCSIPEGQRCMPSTRNTVLLPVFRWDCCWDYAQGVWRWACGWYLVNIQIVTQCYCTCRPVITQ